MNVRSPPFLPPCPTCGRYKERDSPLQQCAQCVQHTSFPCARPTSQCGPRHVQRDQHRGRQRRGHTSLHPRVAETRRCQCSTGVLLRPTTNNNASGARRTLRSAASLHPGGGSSAASHRSAAPFTSPRPSYPRALHYRIADTDKDVCACGTLGNERKDHPDGGNTRSWDDDRIGQRRCARPSIYEGRGLGPACPEALVVLILYDDHNLARVGARERVIQRRRERYGPTSLERGSGGRHDRTHGNGIRRRGWCGSRSASRPRRRPAAGPEATAPGEPARR